MLELLKSIDAFAWGPPLLIFIGWDRDLPNCPSRTLAGFAFAKAFQLIFTKD